MHQRNPEVVLASSRRLSWRRWLVAAFLLLLACNGDGLRGETIDYGFKAHLLYNLSEFTDWPTTIAKGTNDALTIGILGKDPFGHELDTFASSRVTNTRPVTIQRYHQVADAKACQILFISASESKRLPQILKELKGRSILTVSDMKSFAPRGGMVGLVAETDQVQFSINLEALKSAGLNISSKLLRTAEIVTTRKD